MPNNITNRIELFGTKKDIKKLIDEFGTHIPERAHRAYDDSIICENGDNIGWFDEKTNVFRQRNKEDVIGLPDGWKMEILPSFLHFPDFNKVIPQPENIFLDDLSMEDKERCRREGIPTWYDWNRQNWGTKWNSYSCKKEDDNIFIFETAWNSVPKIIDEMSKKFPNVEILYEYADEDVGANTGRFKYKDGIISMYRPDNCSTDSYEIAFKLNPEWKQYYKIVDGKYVDNDE